MRRAGTYQELQSHCIQSEKRRRSRRMSCAARRRSALSSGGSMAGCGASCSSTCWITALSVMIWPSTSSTGRRPEGTCKRPAAAARARRVNSRTPSPQQASWEGAAASVRTIALASPSPDSRTSPDPPPCPPEPHLGHELARLIAVAPHVDLLNHIWHALLLQLQHNLVAVCSKQPFGESQGWACTLRGSLASPTPLLPAAHDAQPTQQLSSQPARSQGHQAAWSRYSLTRGSPGCPNVRLSAWGLGGPCSSSALCGSPSRFEYPDHQKTPRLIISLVGPPGAQAHRLEVGRRGIEGPLLGLHHGRQILPRGCIVKERVGGTLLGSDGSGGATSRPPESIAKPGEHVIGEAAGGGGAVAVAPARVARQPSRCWQPQQRWQDRSVGAGGCCWRGCEQGDARDTHTSGGASAAVGSQPKELFNSAILKLQLISNGTALQ